MPKTPRPSSLESRYFAGDGTVPNSALPPADPVTGEAGPLLDCWRRAAKG